MNTAVTPAQSFEDRMKARIKESIGDLITDEDLSKMVARSMDEVFFKERVNPHNSYHGQHKPLPPLLNEIVQKEMSVQVSLAVAAYIKAHSAEVETAIKDVLQQGMGSALMAAVTQKFQSDLFMFQQNLVNSIQRQP